MVEPFGAHPSYTQGHYHRDSRFYVDWDAISRESASLEAWLDEWVHGLPDRAAYMDRLGPEVAARIRPTGSAPSGSVEYGRYE